jgi:hypothetical protein
MLLDGGDYKVKFTNTFRRQYFENGTWGHEDVFFVKPKRLFFMTTSRVFSLYKAQCLREGEKPMPDSTIEYYLRNSPAFECETKKESFKKIDPRTNLQESSESGEKKRTSTTALVFDIDKTGLSIGDQENAETEDYKEPKATDESKKGELPF